MVDWIHSPQMGRARYLYGTSIDLEMVQTIQEHLSDNRDRVLPITSRNPSGSLGPAKNLTENNSYLRGFLIF